MLGHLAHIELQELWLSAVFATGIRWHIAPEQGSNRFLVNVRFSGELDCKTRAILKPVIGGIAVSLPENPDPSITITVLHAGRAGKTTDIPLVSNRGYIYLSPDNSIRFDSADAVSEILIGSDIGWEHLVRASKQSPDLAAVVAVLSGQGQEENLTALQDALLKRVNRMQEIRDRAHYA